MKAILLLAALLCGELCLEFVALAAEPAGHLSDSLLPITVRPTDLDQKGHVNNARYLEYLQCGRWDWLELRGLSNDAMEVNENTTLVVANVNINYRRPIHYGDAIYILTKAVRKGEKAMIFRQMIRGESHEEYADADVTMVAVDLDTKRSRKLPDSLDKLLSVKSGTDASVATAGNPFHLVAAAESTDAKATTMTLDKTGNAVSVAREGRSIHLMIREATVDTTDPKGVVKLFADGGVWLNRRQAMRLTELLDNAIRAIPEPGEESVNQKAPWLHLVSQCGPNGCRVPQAKRQQAPTAPAACSSGGCSSGACGQSSGVSRRRFFGRGRFLGRRCCR